LRIKIFTIDLTLSPDSVVLDFLYIAIATCIWYF